MFRVTSCVFLLPCISPSPSPTSPSLSVFPLLLLSSVSLTYSEFQHHSLPQITGAMSRQVQTGQLHLLALVLGPPQKALLAFGVDVCFPRSNICKV